MRKMRRVTRIVPILVLLALLVSLVPLAGTACSDDEEEVVTIKADFTASPTSGVAPLTVSFTDKSEGEITSYAWDLDGDGAVDSTEQNPSYTYEAVGAYTVILEVTGPDGVDTAVEAQYISATAVEYQEMTLSLSHELAETHLGGLTAQKFADLIELYTGGAVQVDVFPAGTLYRSLEQFEAVKTGAVDIVWMHPYYLRYMDPNLDWVDSLPKAIHTLAHAEAILEDGRLPAITISYLENENIHLIGYFDNNHVAGYFNRLRECDELSDHAGMRYALPRAGPLGPMEEYAGMEAVVIPYEEHMSALSTGMYDVGGKQLYTIIPQGWDAFFRHAYLNMAPSYHTPMMYLDKWNSLDADLQALINDVIVPETKAYASELVTEAERTALKQLVQKLDSVHMQSIEEAYASYIAIQDLASFQAVLDRTNPILTQVIEELRPAELTWDPIVVEMFEYAGIPLS